MKTSVSMNILNKIIFTVGIFLSFFLYPSIIHAADPVFISPVLNISNNVIQQRTFKIVADYGSEITIDETSIIKLYENAIERPITYVVNGTKIEISKSSNYLPQKSYRLVIQNISVLAPDTVTNDVDTTFRYDSYRVFSIGRSVKGKNIIGYSLGEGKQVYVLMGAIHGNEWNTTKLVRSLFDNFRANPSWIPDDTKLVFIPALNVDGYGAYRLNAHGVDLNRNSGTKIWSAVTWWGYTMLRYGGGRYPNSEPETRAIQNYIIQTKPYMLISYHSAGNYVLTNGSIVRNFARSYANKALYRYVDQSSGGVAFLYPITGDLTIWMRERGYRAITVEMKSKSLIELAPNLKALKYVISAY